MIACTTAADAQEASLIVLELAASGIEAQASADAGAAAFGELPADVLRVRILVPQARLAEARAVLAALQERRRRAREHGARAPWTCASCGEANDATFEVCWRCQATAPGAPAAP